MDRAEQRRERNSHATGSRLTHRKPDRYMDKRIEEFLNRAAEGLRDDTELQLDARAELAAHAEDKLQDLEQEGLPADEAVQQTVKALGEPIAIAADLYNANRRRMNLCAQLRIFMRFALVPLAIAAAVWAADIPAILQTRALMNNEPIDISQLLNLSEKDRLILEGDLSRPTKAEQQKAIWESDPTNRVYFANYFNTCTQNGVAGFPETLLEEARQIDPDNAHYIYAQAIKELNLSWSGTNSAIHVDWSPLDSGENPRIEVMDRDLLDHSMALAEQALNMPDYNDYAFDMIQLRLSKLPRPKRMTEVGARTQIINSAPFSEVTPLTLQLAHIMKAYGCLLLEEGDDQRAYIFLNSWKQLSAQINAHPASLIHLSVTQLILQSGETSAKIYQAAGKPTKARLMTDCVDETRALLCKWDPRKERPEKPRELLDQYGGISVFGPRLLTGMGPLHKNDLAPSRRLEFLVHFTEKMMPIISALFLMTILGCAVVTLRWRSSAAPILLMPRTDTLLHIFAYGIIAPGLIFFLVTRFVPISGHSYSMSIGLHKFIAEHALFTLALLLLPPLLGTQAARKRCRELGTPTAPLFARRLLPVLIIESILFALVWLIPATPSPLPERIARIMATITAGTLAIGALIAFIQGIAGRKEYGLFYGTVFRSMIPLLAGALIVLSLISRPALRYEEAKYIRQDTFFNPSSTLPGGLSLETRATDQFRADLHAVLEKIQTMP